MINSPKLRFRGYFQSSVGNISQNHAFLPNLYNYHKLRFDIKGRSMGFINEILFLQEVFHWKLLE